MNDLIVTIGRENGSWEGEVGRIFVKMLGISCYDREIIEKTSAKIGVFVEGVERFEEKRKNTNLFFTGIPSPNPFFASQAEAIHDIASRDSCVFIGRCADYVLRNKKNVMKVFIHASTSGRIKRSATRSGISQKEAYDKIKCTDIDRAEYYRRITGTVWKSTMNYDLCLDTGKISVQNAEKLTSDYIWLAGLILDKRE